jgi:small subunit ribosomal protein S15
VRPALLKKERLRQQEKQASELREVKSRMQAMTKPDPVLGHQMNMEGDQLWKNSELCKVVLTKDAVWGVREDRRGNLIPIIDETEEANNHPGHAERQSLPHLGPKRLNFGLESQEDRALLFGDLPAVIIEDKIRASSMLTSLSTDDISSLNHSLEADEETERVQSDQLSRILDLRNANGRAIRVENIRRIIEHFGLKRREDGSVFHDSGSPEIQGESADKISTL